MTLYESFYPAKKKHNIVTVSRCSGNDLVEQKYQNVGELIDGKHHAIKTMLVEQAINDVVSFGKKSTNKNRGFRNNNEKN